MGLRQLWPLAVAWYGERLTPEARRPASGEIPGIFARAGLVGPFWDLESPGGEDEP